jgi:hypothetical protein
MLEAHTGGGRERMEGRAPGRGAAAPAPHGRARRPAPAARRGARVSRRAAGGDDAPPLLPEDWRTAQQRLMASHCERRPAAPSPTPPRPCMRVRARPRALTRRPAAACPSPPNADAHVLSAADPLDHESWPDERRRAADCRVRILCAPQHQQGDGGSEAAAAAASPAVAREFPAHSVLLEQACGWAADQLRAGNGSGGRVLELVVAGETEAEAAALLFRCVYSTDEPLRPLVGWSFAPLKQVGGG